jgi:hypothetical protein
VTPTSDSDRVLGQIERGDMWCGPDAARRIAARAMDAYGNAVWGPNPDTAWADALTAVTAASDQSGQREYTLNSRKDVRP